MSKPSPTFPDALERRAALLNVNLAAVAKRTSACWTTERVIRLFELVRSGNSASQAAAILGMSRSAVIGKVFRLDQLGFAIKLESNTTQRQRSDNAKKARSSAKRNGSTPFHAIVPSSDARPSKSIHRPRTPQPDRPKMEPMTMPVPRDEVDVPLKQRRGIAELEYHQCKWPIGDPAHPDFHFCHHKQVPGRPYCEPHCKRAFVPIEIRRKEAHEPQRVVNLAPPLTTAVPETA